MFRLEDLRLEVPNDGTVPKHYGVAWADFVQNAVICYPIPLNFLMAWWRTLRWRLSVGPGASTREQDAYAAGLTEGRSQSVASPHGTAVMQLSLQFLLSLFTQGTQIPESVCRDGLPEGAVMAGIRMLPGVLELLFQHPDLDGKPISVEWVVDESIKDAENIIGDVEAWLKRDKGTRDEAV